MEFMWEEGLCIHTGENEDEYEAVFEGLGEMLSNNKAFTLVPGLVAV